jgi:hypothetical protein
MTLLRTSDQPMRMSYQPRTRRVTGRLEQFLTVVNGNVIGCGNRQGCGGTTADPAVRLA